MARNTRGLSSIWLYTALEGILSLSYFKVVQKPQIRQSLDNIKFNFPLDVHGCVRSSQTIEAAKIERALVFPASSAAKDGTICSKLYDGCDSTGSYCR